MADVNIADLLLALQAANVDLSGMKGKIPGVAAMLASKEFKARTDADRARLLSELGMGEAEQKALLQSSLLDQKYQQQLGLGEQQGARAAELKRLEAELAMARNSQAVELDIQKMREREALRTAQAVELQRKFDAAKPLALGALTKTNELDTILTQMRRLEGGDVMATGIEEMIRRNRTSATENKLDELKTLMKAGGYDVPDEEGLRKVIDSRIERHGPTATLDDIINEQKATAEKARAEQKSADDLRKKLEQTEPGRKSVFRYATAEERQRQLEAGVPVEKIQAENRKTGRLRGIVGGTLAGAVAAGLAAKIFGSNSEAPKLPPEVQMALMQQMQRSGGGGTDPALSEGRDLLNVSRTLGIMKQMQEMAAQAASAATPPVYRLV